MFQQEVTVTYRPFLYSMVESRCENKDVKSLTLYPFRYVLEHLHNLIYDEMYIWYSDAYTCYMCKVTRLFL